MERNKLIIKPSIEGEYTGSPTVDIDGDGVKISNFKELVIDGKVHFGVPAKVLREYIEENYIHQPTADTHVGYNRALGDLRNWLRVLEQEESHG